MQIKSNNLLKITDRILYFLDIKGISKYKFHKDLGFSNGFLDKSRDIVTEKYAKILDYFPDINPRWLLLGEGEPIKKKNKLSDTGIMPAPAVSIDKLDNNFCGQCSDYQKQIIQLQQEIINLQKQIIEIKKDAK